MIKNIKYKYVNILNSSFSNLTGVNKINLNFINMNKKLNLIKGLKNKKFDGWFSSINNDGRNIEVSLFNDKSIFELISSSKLKLDWSNYNGNEYFNQGKKYKINTLKNPIKLIINIKYKKMINDLFQRMYINNKFLPKTVFNIIMHNAEIIYFDDNNRIINADNAITKFI